LYKDRRRRTLPLTPKAQASSNYWLEGGGNRVKEKIDKTRKAVSQIAYADDVHDSGGVKKKRTHKEKSGH